ncbi:hypothetical protein ACVRXQ_13315 [Streptococcus panodentis]
MVKVNYGSLQTQSSSLSSASQSRVAGFNQLISVFDSFGGNGGELIGTGYDAARAYATNVMSPFIIKGAFSTLKQLRMRRTHWRIVMQLSVELRI